MSRELQEIRNILEEYIQGNCTSEETSGGLYLHSDIKALQQKEADKYSLEQMKVQHKEQLEQLKTIAYT